MLLPGKAPYPNHAAYGFLRQIGMILSFVTACPANWWPTKRGIKEAMYWPREEVQ